MMERGVIHRSCSPWSSGIVVVKKKDGSTRFCIDYRKLNNVTIKVSHPLPRMNDSLDALGKSKWFSTLDLARGYWQVAMNPKDTAKTAFATICVFFEFISMPFGLCNAPATFQKPMENVLLGLQRKACLLYVDDVIISMIISFARVELNLSTRPFA